MTELRKKFLDEVKKLDSDTIELCELTRKNYILTLKALENYDKELAIKVIRGDEQVNNLEEKINEDAVLLIARQAPVATDLRRIITILKISNDIERIADYAVNIAKYVAYSDELILKYSNKVLLLASKMLIMLDDIMEAFRTQDIEKAKATAEMDSELDEMYKKILKELMTSSTTCNEDEVKAAFQTIIIIKQIERAGDHITNIAENIIYQVKGKRCDLN